MKEIGAFEAKNKLSEILRAVERGERFIITRRGKPVAEIGPPPGEHRLTPQEAVARIEAIREKNVLGGLSIRELIEEGRRF